MRSADVIQVPASVDGPVPLALRRGDRVIAVPAFRTLAWVDGTLADDATRAEALSLFDLFVSRCSGGSGFDGSGPDSLGPDSLARMHLASDKVDQRIKKWSADAARDWIDAARANPMTMQAHGAADEVTDIAGPPQIRIEQRNGQLKIEVTLSPVRVDTALADDLARCLTGMPLLCGLQSLGFYLPSALRSLARHLPQSFPRYRAAVELVIDDDHGLRRLETARGQPVGAYADFPDALGGLPDLGWRTFVGAPYRSRLAPLAATEFHGAVTVEDRAGILTLTAGAAPVWGDVNDGEDIGAYQSIAAYLRPVMVDLRVARRSMFGGKETSVDDRETLERYLTRLLPPDEPGQRTR